MDIDIDITQPEQATPIVLDVSTGVSYTTLDKKPQINGVILVDNKTPEELGLQPQGDYANKDDIPTKISQLVNDSGFITKHQDISNLATKTELETKQDELIAGDNITIVNNVISSIGGVLDAYTKLETDSLLDKKQDVGNYALKSEIPTMTSQLTNNSGFLTEHQDISGKQDKLIAGTNITIVDNVISSTASVSEDSPIDAYTKVETDNLLLEKADIEFAKDAGCMSKTYDNLTLGESGDIYIAPTNGAFYLAKFSTTAGQGMTIYANGVWGTSCWIPTANTRGVVFMPAKKGDEVTINYSTKGETKYFRFIYAEGEV